MRERLERQERLVTTGTLAAGVGREVNNPLTFVAANVDFALDGIRTIAGASPSGRMREIFEVLGKPAKAPTASARSCAACGRLPEKMRWR